jgi:CNT family concentrative nucleoside transporter
MLRLISLAGLFVMMILAWLVSADRRKMNVRLIASGIVLQFLLAILILWTTPGHLVFAAANNFITHLIEFSNAGAEFVFGTGFKEHFFAFSVLPAIIFVSSAMTVLFHLGVLQKFVEFMAKIMVYIMDAAGSESLVTAANVFMGLAEAPLVIRPYIDTMTKSEIMAMMVAGMATISGGLLAAYAGLGANAGHLLTASIISAPAALVIAKIMYPEKNESMTKGVVKVQIPKEDVNVLDAACRGAADGTKLAINVGAVLICFIAFVALFNWLLSFLPAVSGEPLTLERMLGWLCAPLAWIMGVEWKDAGVVGMLIGKKTIMNEFIAYVDLVKYKDVITDRSFTIATYALCGFANFGSVAIQIGGIGTLVPSRRNDFAKLGIKAMIGGSLAAFMTATVAGILI